MSSKQLKLLPTKAKQPKLVRVNFTFLVILAATLLGIVFFALSHKPQPESDESFELKLSTKEFLLMSLSSELEQLNLDLPRRLDKNTLLNSISIEDSSLIYVHTLENIPEASLTPNLLETSIIPQLTQQVCLDENKRVFLDNQITLVMKYFDQEKTLVFSTVIAAQDCKQ